MKVVTYQSPSGAKISLSLKQAARCEAVGIWCKDWRGEEYCTVSRGEYHGHPDYSDEEFEKIYLSEP